MIKDIHKFNFWAGLVLVIASIMSMIEFGEIAPWWKSCALGAAIALNSWWLGKPYSKDPFNPSAQK